MNKKTKNLPNVDEYGIHFDNVSDRIFEYTSGLERISDEFVENPNYNLLKALDIDTKKFINLYTKQVADDIYAIIVGDKQATRKSKKSDTIKHHMTSYLTQWGKMYVSDITDIRRKTKIEHSDQENELFSIYTTLGIHHLLSLAGIYIE